MFEALGHISPKTKLLFAVILLIFLPSAFLSYFGLQSIDQKAERLRANYRASINLIRDKVEREVVQLEEDLPKSLPSLELQTSDLKKLRSWLQSLDFEHPSVKNPFLLNTNGGMISTMVSLRWKDGRPDSRNRIARTPSFQKAEESEYVKKEFLEAISFYRSALAEARSGDERALMFSRIGRCYWKGGRYQEAIQEYGKVLKTPSVTIGPVPAYVIALSQMADAYAAMGDVEREKETTFRLYQMLLDLPWPLDDENYTFYLTSAGGAVAAESPSISNLHELKKRESCILDQALLLNLLRREAIDMIGSQLRRSSTPELQSDHISVDDGNSRRQLGYIKMPARFQRVGLVALGYELDKQYVLADVVPNVLKSVDLGLEVAVGLTDEHDSVLFVQGDIQAHQYLLAGNLGQSVEGWKVALFDRFGRSLDEQAADEKRLYFMFLGGLMLVLILGIVVTVRAATHEIETARIKSDFVANVSHELKTPLALIRMFGETLETGIVENEAKRREFYGIIRRESERLTHLINNMLDFSKIDAGIKQYVFQRADLVEVIKSTLQAYMFQINDLGFEIESDLPGHPIVVRIDKEAIPQALLNLLSNATKYSKNRKRIHIEVTQNSSEARIVVTDEGIGIPDRELTKVFAKFYRGSSSAMKETRGAGLGLTVVKHIVEAHRGTIRVQSVEGKGSSFILEIPLLKNS